MPKFNVKAGVGSLPDRPDATANKEGGLAYKASPKTELTLRVLTWLVGEPKFYENKDETTEIETLIGVVAKQDPEYILKLAAYARNEMNLRSAPVYLLVESAQYDGCKPHIRKWTPSIIRRVDELTETVALYTTKHGDLSRGTASLAKSLQKGIADSFHSFDAYQFAKYNRGGKVKILDVMRLSHPKPRNEDESLLFKMIKDDNLPTPETWETVISANGSTKEAWTSVLPKMGYMAKLRNLRNFVKTDVDLEPVLQHLTNPKAVANSRQFPFRFWSAYKVVDEMEATPFKANAIRDALEKALELSVSNLPNLPGRTAIFTDNSGSMKSPISARSTVQRIEIGNLMGALAYKMSDNAVVGCFGETYRTVPLTGKTILENARKLWETNVGHSTNGWLAIKYLIDNGIVVDRVLVFSDMQLYTTYSVSGLWRNYNDPAQSLYGQWMKYRAIAPKSKLYSFDLAGYGTLQTPEDDTGAVTIGGWDEKVLKFIRMYESFGEAQLSEIDGYTPLVTKGDEEEE